MEDKKQRRGKEIEEERIKERKYARMRRKDNETREMKETLPLILLFLFCALMIDLFIIFFSPQFSCDSVEVI